MVFRRAKADVLVLANTYAKTQKVLISVVATRMLNILLVCHTVITSFIC